MHILWMFLFISFSSPLIHTLKVLVTPKVEGNERRLGSTDMGYWEWQELEVGQRQKT